MQKKIITQYYVLSCLFNAGGMSIISAVYVTFLIKNGLNLFEVNVVNAAYFLTLFVCEIPTGAFADIFGRKKSFVLACALLSASMLMYGLSHTLLGFICAEIVAAVANTFRSGAFQAWLVDSLKHHGYEGEFAPIFGHEGFIRQAGGAVGAVTGSYLAVLDSSWPWLFGGAVTAVTAVIAQIIMREPYFTRKKLSFKIGISSMKEVALSSIRYGKSDPAVRFILVLTCIQLFSVQALNMYWQPFFEAKGVGQKGFGYMFIGMMTALSLGAYIASRLDSTGKERQMILASVFIAGALAVIAAILPGLPLPLAVFIIHEIPRGCWGPLIDSYLHKRIPSEERATIASFCSIAPHIGGVFGLLASGAIAQLCGISTSWIVAGASLILGAVLIWKRENSSQA